MNRHILILLLALISFPTLGQDSYKILVRAYKSDSIPLLEEFLDNWNRKSEPVTNFDGLSVIEENTYAIYQDFFNPFSIDKYGKQERGTDLYSKIKYVIIQNNIQAIVLKTDSIDHDFRSYPDSIVKEKINIHDFKPNLRFENAKILYMTSDYADYLNKFLKKKHYKLGHGGIMNPARAKGSAVLKQDFLNSKLQILHGHWGGYWHLETHPQIGNIIFNRDLTQAKINFRIAYQGGESYYLKKDGKWIMKSSEITWIE
jgi:hypothetical protein